MLLRVRMADGSMERLQIPPGAETTMSLQAALAGLISDDEDKDNLTIRTIYGDGGNLKTVASYTYPN